MNSIPGLKRTLSLPMVTLYGMGTILGAGIYVLIGEVAGVAGYRAPLAFLVAAGRLVSGINLDKYPKQVVDNFSASAIVRLEPVNNNR